MTATTPLPATAAAPSATTPIHGLPDDRRARRVPRRGSAVFPNRNRVRPTPKAVIANEEEEAIGFSGKVSLNALLALAGALTRIAEGGDGCGAAPVAGVTLRGSGFLGALRIGPTALGECVGLGLAGGDAIRAISPVEPLRSGLPLGLVDGLDSIVGDEFESMEGTFAKDSESRVFSLDFSSESVASSSLLASEELSESMRDRLVTAGDGPIGLTREAESAGRALRD